MGFESGLGDLVSIGNDQDQASAMRYSITWRLESLIGVISQDIDLKFLLRFFSMSLN